MRLSTRGNMFSITDFKEFFEKKLTELSELEIVGELGLSKKGSTTTALKKIAALESEISGGLELKSISAEMAEVISFIIIKEFFSEKEVEYSVGSSKFPDIRVGKLGFEVKTSSENKGMLGNSALQADPGVDEIFAIVFFTGKVEPRIVPYEELVRGVKVDHNPRFYLDLSGEEFESDDDLFGGISFAEFMKLPKEKKHSRIKKYLKKAHSGESWRWFMEDNSGNEDILLAMIEGCVKAWKNIDKTELRVRCYAEIPEKVFYDKGGLRNFVLREYNAFGPVKDVFTAGGRREGFPAVFANLIDSLDEVKDYLIKTGKSLKLWKDAIFEIISEGVGKPINSNGLTLGQADSLRLKIEEM